MPMNNLIRSTTFIAAVIVWSAGTSAQTTSRLDVHPDSIVPGSPFLIDVSSFWLNGCGGHNPRSGR